jgi:hypothetical protein
MHPEREGTRTDGWFPRMVNCKALMKTTTMRSVKKKEKGFTSAKKSDKKIRRLYLDIEIGKIRQKDRPSGEAS